MLKEKGNEVAANIRNAWEKLEPWVLAEDGEMERRLARRQTRAFRSPLRAFCVSIRASDNRIDDATAIDPRYTGRCEEHTVRITDELVYRVCAPAQIIQYGQLHDEVARMLGTTSDSLRRLRRNGRFRVRTITHVGGRRGKPVPILANDEILDPAAREKRAPDEVFGSEWLWTHIHMPAGFTQTVTRIPRCRRRPGRPDRDQFHGWDWICPCCRRPAYNLYYPLPSPDLAIELSWAPSSWPWQQHHCPIFACRECHHVINFNRARLDYYWNDLVLHYSGGLLYGHEVKKPAWLSPAQPRPHTPPAESPQRLEIKRLLATTTLTHAEIARRFAIASNSVGATATRIYHREAVANRDELRAKLANTYPPDQQHPARCAG